MAKTKPTDLVCDFCRKLADYVCALCDRDGCMDHLPVLLTASFRTISVTSETAVVGGVATRPTHQECEQQVHQPLRICSRCAKATANYRGDDGIAGTILDKVFPQLVKHLRDLLRSEAAARTLQDSR